MIVNGHIGRVAFVLDTCFFDKVHRCFIIEVNIFDAEQNNGGESDYFINLTRFLLGWERIIEIGSVYEGFLFL